jgi:hypothetical protein
MNRWVLAGIFSLGSATAALAANPTGFILGQGSNGDVYQISTADASVSLYLDLDPIAGIVPNSPNGLGVNIKVPNVAFRTDYNNAATPNYLYRNNEQLIEIAGANQSVASGDVVGDDFYYIDRAGGFYVVDDIFGAAGNQTLTKLADIPLADQTYGDIAIRGDLVYTSLGRSFGVFDLSNPAAGFTTLVSADFLFAGLAFDGDMLYGFTADGNTLTNSLYSISIAMGPTFGAATFIGDILIDGVMLTDAAPRPVPLPLPALMLIGGLAGLGFLKRRKIKMLTA